MNWTGSLESRLILAVPEGRDNAVIFILAEDELPPRRARLPPPGGRELRPQLQPRWRSFTAFLAIAFAARVVDRLAAFNRPGGWVGRK